MIFALIAQIVIGPVVTTITNFFGEWRQSDR
jgi:hypothetical protein